jgi:hypothetical protein
MSASATTNDGRRGLAGALAELTQDVPSHHSNAAP